MEDAGFPPDPTTHAVIAANYRRLGRDAQVQDLALSALNYLPPATATFMINQLLETHVQFDDELGFHQLLLLFDSSVIEPLRILLDPLGSRANLAKPLPTLESVNSVAPDVNTFLISMRFCIARSDLPTAEKIFCLLEQQGFRLSPSILAAFLDLQFALDCPCLAVFITSRLLTKHGLDDLFNRLTNCEPDPFWLWQFTTPEISPSIEIFNVLLRGLVNIQGLEAARIILELMKRTDVEPNSYTIKILIDYLLHSRRASPSLVLRTLRQLTPLFRPSLYHLHPILSYLLRLEKRRLYSSKYKIAKVQAWAARKGHEEDVDPDLTKPAAGLKLEHSLGRPNLVRSLLQSLESRGVRSDSPMLGLRMRYEGLIRRDASAVVDVYNDMLAQGMTPSAYHAAALMEVMRSLKVKPNIVMYTILLQGYAHQGQPKAAVQLFQDMISHDIQPDVRAICSLCNAFVLVRQRPYARKLLLTLWTLVGPRPRDHYKLPLYRLLQVFRTLHKPMKASKWKISQENCGWLRRDLVKVVKTYKRAAGLPRALVPSSPRIRRLTKRLLHISRKL
jgi:pentatricopeptide repeat protein